MKLTYTAPIYGSHLTPHGALPSDIPERSSAAWHFTRLAMKALDKVPEQATLEGEVDKTVNLRAIAESVGKLYSLQLDQFLPLVSTYCRKEAFLCQYPWNDRLQAWLDSGGRAYDEVTREEGSFASKGGLD